MTYKINYYEGDGYYIARYNKHGDKDPYFSHYFRTKEQAEKKLIEYREEQNG